LRELSKRILTGFIAGPAVLALFLFLPPFGFFLLVVFLSGAAVYEATRLAGARRKGMITCLSLLLLLPLYFALFPFAVGWLTLSPVIFLFVEYMSRVAEERDVNREIVHSVACLVMCQIFLVVPLYHLSLLREEGRYIPLVLLLSLWASDVMAYFVGKNFGKRLLVPRISPKKTWAGLGGALAGGVIIVVLARAILHIDLWHAIAAGILVGLLGQAGDIFESAAKRIFGAKDSSGLIPGHGGILDRLDSFIFTAPFFYYFLYGVP